MNRAITTKTNTNTVTRLARALLPAPGSVLFTLLVVGLVFFAQRVGALPSGDTTATNALPSMIRYQGRLTDLNGVPQNGDFDMVFRLYTQQDKPVDQADWVERHTADRNAQVTVEDGLFNVWLGSLDPIPGGLLTGGDLYLGVQVANDEEMSPRERLTGVPFALLANAVADGAVTTAKLADGAVTSAKLNLATGDVYLGQGGGGSASKLRWDNTAPDVHWLGYDSAIAPWWMIFSTHRNEGFIFRNDADGTVVQIGGSNSPIGKGISLNGNLNMTGVIQSSNNIPTAALQDGAVNSRKLRPNTLFARHDQPANVGGGGAEFFGAGSVCVEVASNVLLLATVNFYTTGGGGQLNFYVKRDGAQVGSTFHQDINTGKEVVTIVMLDQNVGPGCHSYSVWGDGALGQASEKNFVAIPFAR